MNHNIKKTVIINRGIPASGKSTMARQIQDSLKIYNYHVAIHSTDDYFIKNGKYVFTVKKAGVNHKKNQNAFLKDLCDGVDIVICDNTNLSPSQTIFYTTAAREYGYFVIYLSYHPRDIESHISSQLLVQDPYLSHEVPKEVIRRMLDEYEMYNSIFGDVSEDKNNISMSFDEDAVIEVDPGMFEQKKSSIGLDILNLIRIENDSCKEN